MSLRKLLYLLLTVSTLSSCKKDKLYFQKIEIIGSNTTARLNKIKFLNDSVCIVAGGERFYSSALLRSMDGGHTWQNYAFTEIPKGIYELETSPSGTLYGSAFDAYFLSSSNLGQSWDFKSPGNWQFHTGLAFANANRLIMVSRDGQKAGNIIVADSNLSIQRTISYNFGLNDVAMVSPQVGYVAGYGAILKTIDGGDKWEYLDIENDNFLVLCCLGQTELWACGYNGSIVHSADAGKTWDRYRNGNNISLPKYHLQDMVFLNPTDGWAVGEKGLVIYTKDGGKNWTAYNSLGDFTLTSIAVCPNKDLLIAGEKGKLFRIHP
jgi:photosystem II stability/assembly factor-like uncharacterized protein